MYALHYAIRAMGAMLFRQKNNEKVKVVINTFQAQQVPTNALC